MTAAELIKKYDIRLFNSEQIAVTSGEKAKKDNAIDIIKENKAEIISILTAEQKAKEEKETKIKAIEGLKEIEKARFELENFYERLAQAMDNEYTSGILPSNPITNLKELENKYPRAVAYLKAERWFLSKNYTKSDLGGKALNRIINGDPYKNAIDDMEREWSDYCSENVD